MTLRIDDIHVYNRVGVAFKKILNRNKGESGGEEK